MKFADLIYFPYLPQPKVKVKANLLTARSSLFNQLYTLFSYCRTVRVDKDEQTITIRTRFLWLFSKSRKIPFSRIKKIDHSYKSLPLGWDIYRSQVFKRYERYIVSVVLDSPPEKVKLFTFSGYEYDFEGPFYSVGSQDRTSQSYVDLLKEFTGRELTYNPGRKKTAGAVRRPRPDTLILKAAVLLIALGILHNFFICFHLREPFDLITAGLVVYTCLPYFICLCLIILGLSPAILLCGVIPSLLFDLIMYSDIITSTSSTSGIGLFFVPVYDLALIMPAGLITGVIIVLLKKGKIFPRKSRLKPQQQAG